MPEVDQLRSVRSWLRQTGIPLDVDHPALDRMADVVLNAMAAEGGDKPELFIKLTVLMKVQAMLLAKACETDEGIEAVDRYCAQFADGLAGEVMNFRAAFARDARRSAGASRRVG